MECAICHSVCAHTTRQGALHQSGTDCADCEGCEYGNTASYARGLAYLTALERTHMAVGKLHSKGCVRARREPTHMALHCLP